MVLTGAWYVTYHDRTMKTFRDVIAAWPDLETMAEDAGVVVGTVKQWRNRDNIPGEYWLRLDVGATKRQIAGVTMYTLGRIPVPKPPKTQASADAA